MIPRQAQRHVLEHPQRCSTSALQLEVIAHWEAATLNAAAFAWSAHVRSQPTALPAAATTAELLHCPSKRILLPLRRPGSPSQQQLAADAHSPRSGGQEGERERAGRRETATITCGSYHGGGAESVRATVLLGVGRFSSRASLFTSLRRVEPSFAHRQQSYEYLLLPRRTTARS